MSTPRRSFRPMLAFACAAAAAAQTLPGEVEKQVKLDALAPGLVGKLHVGDRLGRAVATVRDLDNDGHGDIVVGAPWDDDGGPERGAVWILFLNGDGTIKSTAKISSTQGLFLGTLQDNNHFGNAVSYLGDLDGDGTGDIAVSALGDDDGGTDTGAVWILFLKEDGTVQRFQKISPLFGELHLALEPGDRFGRSVAGLADIDGDGVVDMAVGAIGDDDGAIDAGCVYVLYLNANGTVKKTSKISATSGGFAGVLHANDRFGQATAAFDDHDGDGTPDLLVGAWLDDTGGIDAGALWEVGLKPDGSVKWQLKIAQGVGGFSGPLGAGDRFGGALATLGDLDGDAISDITVGSVHDDDGGTNQGAVWNLFLNADGSVKGQQKVSALEGNFGGPLADDDDFGAVAAIEDLNGDGVVDLGVGAFGDDGLGTFTGAVWILQMHASQWKDLGHALAGALGEPHLQGLGSLLPATEIRLLVSHAPLLTPALLVMGGSELDVPLYGGLLVPAPDKLYATTKTNALGQLEIKGRWPGDAQPGDTLWLQAWIPDATAPQGYAATNGLHAIAP